MSLVARIFVNMGAMVALVILVGCFASLRTSDLAETFFDYRETARTSLLASEMAQTVAEIRLSSLKYRSSDELLLFDDVSQNVANASRLAPELIAALEGYADQDALRSLPVLLQEYKNTMEGVSQLRRRKAKLIGVTTSSGRVARKHMTEEMMNPALGKGIGLVSATGLVASNLILGRLYLERFLVFNNPSDIARSTSEIENARLGLNEIANRERDPEVLKFVEDTLGALDQFATAAVEIGTTIEERNTLYARMDALGPELLDLVNSAVAAVVGRQNVLGPAGEASARTSITVVSGLVAIGALLGLLLATVAGRSIATRLQRITDDMTQLAEGNLNIDIETGVEKHEIGRMTDAMAVFLQNARTARDLDAEVKETERKERERLEKERAQEKRLEKQRLQEEKERSEGRSRMEMLEGFQNDMEQVMGEAASGNFSVRMSDNVDDAGLVNLANLVNQQLQATEKNISDIVLSLAELARGNLAVRIEGNRKGVFQAMKDDFNASMSTLSETMGKFLTSGESVSKTSVNLKNSSKDLSRRAEDNAATVEQTSAAVEEITASIRQVVASAQAADQATQRVRQSADETRAVSTETEASINAMTDASAQINRVVKVIEDIAFQINLLALNAGVEAARAGEAGLGFSVVASEVRALALRSQEAVQEITTVIDQSNLSVEAGAKQVGLSRQALEGIITEVEVASGQISEIASAVKEQAKGIEEVNTAIRAIDVNAQKNAATLEEMTASSESLSDEAIQLSAALGAFEGVTSNKTAPLVSKPNSSPSKGHIISPPPKKVAVVAGSPVETDDDGWDEF